MKLPSREEVKRRKEKYKEGMRVKLEKMTDIQAPEVGTHGTITGVDDAGDIMVRWDNGSSLKLIVDEDTFEILPTVKTICYGKEKIWDTIDEAIAFFEQGIKECEGSERERYAIIYTKLILGRGKKNLVCTDLG